MPSGPFNELMKICASIENNDPPFASTDHLYHLIDSQKEICLEQLQNDPNTPSWKLAEYDFWFQDAKDFWGAAPACLKQFHDRKLGMEAIWHPDGVSLLGFLSIPKDDPEFRKFRLNLDSDGPQSICCCHELSRAFIQSLTIKELWNDYGIVDGILPFTAKFPHADIHELIAPDILHQLIKGTFKDHLVTWIERIAAVPSFPGLRQFPQGRGFKQWTGDDCKTLMKVFLPVIKGLVPPEMVMAMAAFIDFCYLVCCSHIDEANLQALDKALIDFHGHQQIFSDYGVCSETISLPCQHALKHYHHHIEEFGAPVGLCTPITENKHIKAVKKPYQKSSHN
ncbi:hypothetical protein V8B97DRAFT_1918017 [Scleroderma yunnanense]